MLFREGIEISVLSILFEISYEMHKRGINSRITVPCRGPCLAAGDARARAAGPRAPTYSRHTHHT